MDNRSSYVLYVPGRPRPTFVSTNNVVFGNKCPMAKDSPNVIDNGEVALDFPPEAHLSEISSSSVDANLDQTDTHYMLCMDNVDSEEYRYLQSKSVFPGVEYSEVGLIL